MNFSPNSPGRMETQGVKHLDLAVGGWYTFFKFMRLVQDIALYACFGCFS